ncbi:MAG: PD-(D/E)XK nuclease family protein [Eggerthellaceae bacterium]|nr:PD-(D/E)XK nuclease family protein [Eggerthellaceae bacterium]
MVNQNIFNRGEEKLSENLSEKHQILEALEKVNIGEEVEFDFPDHLSPSGIELYVDCPFKYYIQRMLSISSIDAQFGPLEKGCFVHHVMKEFYSKLPSRLGISKVTEEQIDNCKDYLGNVFDSLLEEEEDFFALSYFEDKEIELLRRNLLNMLDFEAQFLSNMEPKHFEYLISHKDTNFAGFPLLGKIDRIDSSEKGELAVVDYKESAGDCYMIFDKNRIFPEKLQTLIYAKVAGEKLDLRVAAALYLSYGCKRNAAGVMAPDILGSPQMNQLKASFSVEKMDLTVDKFLSMDFSLNRDFVKPASVAEVDRNLLWAYCWKQTKVTTHTEDDFLILLEAVEKYCSYFVEFWQNADFACNPCSADSCTYCAAAAFCKRGV